MRNQLFSRALISTGFLSVTSMMLMALMEVVVARLLGVREYGAFASNVALATTLGALIGLGLPQLALKTLRNDELWACRGEINCASAAVSNLTMLHAAALLLVGSTLYLALGTGVATPLVTWLALPASIAGKIGIRRILTGLDEPSRGLFFDEIVPLMCFLALGGVQYALTGSLGTAGTVLAMMVAANAISMYVVSSLQTSSRFLRPITTLTIAEAADFYKQSLHFVPFVVAFIAAKKIDVVILGVVSGSNEVAMYAAAAKLALPAMAVTSALGMVFTKEIASVFQRRSREELKRVLHRSALVSMLASAPYVVVILVAPRFVLGHVFGQEFESAAPVLILLAIGGLISAATGPLVLMFSMTKLSSKLARITTIYLAVLCLGVLVLSVWQGAFGAAAASIIAGLIYRGLLWRQLSVETAAWQVSESDLP